MRWLHGQRGCLVPPSSPFEGGDVTRRRRGRRGVTLSRCHATGAGGAKNQFATSEIAKCLWKTTFWNYTYSSFGRFRLPALFV